jgi:integrase
VLGQKEVKYPKLKDALLDVLAVKIASSRHRTKLTYTSVINIFVEFLNNKNYDLLAKDFSQKHFYEFRDYLLTVKKVANITANNYLGHLKVFFNALVAREIIEKSPTKGVLNLQTTVGSSNIAFTKDEQTKLEQYLMSNEIGLYYFTRFIYYGFIRPKELLELQIRHIDLEKNKITLPANISKNKKQEWVTIPKALRELITEMKLDILPKNYYIFSKDLLPGVQSKHRNMVTNLHSQVLKKTNMYNGNLTLYSWKHTGVCNAYKAGLDIVSLQKQLRHHSLAMTEIYLKSLSLIDNDNVLNANW